MDTNPQETQTTSRPDMSAAKKDSGVGPIIGSVIIILLIILGGLYYWGYVIEKESTEPTVQDEELNQIDAELNSTSTDPDQTDDELNQIDAEIDAAFE